VENAQAYRQSSRVSKYRYCTDFYMRRGKLNIEARSWRARADVMNDIPDRKVRGPERRGTGSRPPTVRGRCHRRSILIRLIS